MAGPLLRGWAGPRAKALRGTAACLRRRLPYHSLRGPVQITAGSQTKHCRAVGTQPADAARLSETFLSGTAAHYLEVGATQITATRARIQITATLPHTDAAVRAPQESLQMTGVRTWQPAV